MEDWILLLFCLFLIYIGSALYTLAAYYHLSLNEKWSFWYVYLAAIPIVLLEYVFSLHGIHYLHSWLDFSPIHILVITLCFYFVNLWLLNYFVLHHTQGNLATELFCFGCIIVAFLFSTILRPSRRKN